MKFSLVLFTALVSQADCFFMMMNKQKEGDGQMMMAASSPTPSTTKTESTAKETKATPKEEKQVDCITPDALEKALEKAKVAESALDLARQAEQKAQEALKASQDEISVLQQDIQKQTSALDLSRHSEEKALDALKASQEEVTTLRDSLHKQTVELEKSSEASEKLVKLHEEMLSEMVQINASSEKQFSALKNQIEAEMQRQREKLRVDHVTVARVEELEKEKAGYLGELKALHQLYNRLDSKYDAKMQEEEEEKLAYFAKSLDEEVAKIVGERELLWEASMAELRNESELALNETRAEAEEKLIKLRTDLEDRAERQAEKVQQAHEKEVAVLEHKIKETEHALAEALEKANRNLADVKAAHAKELELAESNALQRLDDLRKKLEGEAAAEAARVQQLHDAEVARLETEIQKAREETKRALEKSEQIDSNLRLTNEERERQKEKYQGVIDGLKKELREAHEETAYWMKAFAKRAYFNSTQLGEDMVMFAEEMQTQITERALEIKQRSVQYTHQQADQISKATEPYTRPAAEFYGKHLSKHVQAADAALRPLYDKNVAPILEDIRLFCRQKTTQSRKVLDDGFDDLVSLARKRCKSSRKEIESAPSMIRNRLRNVCKDPAAVIRDALRMIVVILIIIFRKRIWNLIWGTIKMTFGVIWYIVSFGFLRKKKPPPRKEKTDAEAADTDKLNLKADVTNEMDPNGEDTDEMDLKAEDTDETDPNAHETETEQTAQ